MWGEAAAESSLESARSAKRGYGKTHEQNGDPQGRGDKPMRHVASPGAERGVEPGQGENGEQGSDDFKKKLLESAPKTLESAQFRGGIGSGRHGLHDIAKTRDLRKTDGGTAAEPGQAAAKTCPKGL